MNGAYTPLPAPAQDPFAYPPGGRTKALLSRLAPTAPPTRIRRLLVLAAVLGLSSTLLVYLIFSASLSSPFALSSVLRNPSRGPGSVYADGAGYTGPGDPRSPFFRDPHPALHARLFLARAQAEIAARRLDTCGGQLGGRMVDAYLAAAVPYCSASSTSSSNTSHEQNGSSTSSITCFPARAGDGTPNQWWPYQQAFCASRNLAHSHGWGGDVRRRGLFSGHCAITEAGATLKANMGGEVFLGTEFDDADNEDSKEGHGEQACGERIEHPVLFVPRQDRWNPFHVGEDLVTTFLALTLFSRHVAPSAPSSAKLWTALPAALASSSSSAGTESAKAADLAHQLEAELRGAAGLQLVFQDDHRPTESLFAPLYDRIGAFTPRRTGAEALGVGGPTCFSTAFHSVGAGASLLSATNIGREHKCASELVWGAGLWLRWVWGLEGAGVPGGSASASSVFRRDDEGAGWERESVEGEGAVERRAERWEAESGDPVQVLFLSREKFDEFTKHQNKKLLPWQETRHITNEAALKEGLRKGLAGLCRVGTVGGPETPAGGAHECTYTDVNVLPDTWGVRMHALEARALGLAGAAGASGPAGGEARGSEGDVHGDAQTKEHPPASFPPDKRAPTRRPPRALRFATLDPTTTALPTQLGMVGRADVVVSVHAGALGLTLFMPTGRASVVELVTTGAAGNHHFHNMAHMLGMQYVRVDVARTVDVTAVVNAVKKVVEARL
ncbi:hypothetical protein FB451DRAFT_1375098 [Mycena latifolia]|nr:hypothetical protein FB451DRAFT_1375098 [Mycena latifolia]